MKIGNVKALWSVEKVTVWGLISRLMTVANNWEGTVQHTVIALALWSVVSMTTNADQDVVGKAQLFLLVVSRVLKDSV